MVPLNVPLSGCHRFMEVCSQSSSSSSSFFFLLLRNLLDVDEGDESKVEETSQCRSTVFIIMLFLVLVVLRLHKFITVLAL